MDGIARPPDRIAPAVATARAMHLLHQGVVVPDYEKLLQCVYERLLQPGDIVVDIGAHRGRHCHSLLKAAGGDRGRLIAFEPLPHLARRLRRSFKRCSNVDIREIALSDRQGIASFTYHPDAPGESGLIERFNPVRRRKSRILQVQLDLLDNQLQDLAALSFIKLDVEGGELAVLRGGERAISRLRPLIAIEYGRAAYEAHGHDAGSLYAWCEAHAYRPSDLFGNLILGEAEWLQVCDRSYWDYLLVPEERSAFFQHAMGV